MDDRIDKFYSGLGAERKFLHELTVFGIAGRLLLHQEGIQRNSEIPGDFLQDIQAGIARSAFKGDDRAAAYAELICQLFLRKTVDPAVFPDPASQFF